MTIYYLHVAPDRPPALTLLVPTPAYALMLLKLLIMERLATVTDLIRF